MRRQQEKPPDASNFFVYLKKNNEIIRQISLLSINKYNQNKHQIFQKNYFFEGG
jgi:hypothetical protein